MDRFAVEIAVPHHLGAAQDLGVELESPIHVLNREAEMLGALEPRAQRSAIAVGRGGLAGTLSPCLGRK